MEKFEFGRLTKASKERIRRFINVEGCIKGGPISTGKMEDAEEAEFEIIEDDNDSGIRNTKLSISRKNSP